MREIKDETFYGVKEIPNVIIDCKYKDGRHVKFYCDLLKKFSFENHDSKIICNLTTALMSNSLWTEIMFNNLNQNFQSPSFQGEENGIILRKLSSLRCF